MRPSTGFSSVLAAFATLTTSATMVHAARAPSAQAVEVARLHDSVCKALDRPNLLLDTPQITRLYNIHARSAAHRQLDRNCDGLIDADETAQFQNEIEREAASLRAPARPARGRSLPFAVPPTPSPLASAPPAAAAVGTQPFLSLAKPTDPKLCADFSAYPIVRNSYDDLYLVPTTDCPPDATRATGAQVSFLRDGIAHNTQWSAKGVVAERFLWIGHGENNDDPYLNILAVAPIVRFQRTANSNAKLKTQDVDILSYGISSEFLFNQVLDPYLQVYARFRANANGNFSGDVNSFSMTAEIQPVYEPWNLGTNVHLGPVDAWATVAGRMQYFERYGSERLPIFALRDQVLRAGAAVSLNIIPSLDETVPDWARKLVGSLTYQWYQDTLSRLQFRHLMASLTYNITSNIGLSLSYETGNIEETARRIDQTKLGLTVKY